MLNFTIIIICVLVCIALLLNTWRLFEGQACQIEFWR